LSAAKNPCDVSVAAFACKFLPQIDLLRSLSRCNQFLARKRITTVATSALHGFFAPLRMTFR
jgi:hypothetical protein